MKSYGNNITIEKVGVSLLFKYNGVDFIRYNTERNNTIYLASSSSFNSAEFLQIEAIVIDAIEQYAKSPDEFKKRHL